MPTYNRLNLYQMRTPLILYILIFVVGSAQSAFGASSHLVGRVSKYLVNETAGRCTLLTDVQMNGVLREMNIIVDRLIDGPGADYIQEECRVAIVSKQYLRVSGVPTLLADAVVYDAKSDRASVLMPLPLTRTSVFPIIVNEDESDEVLSPLLGKQFGQLKLCVLDRVLRDLVMMSKQSAKGSSLSLSDSQLSSSENDAIRRRFGAYYFENPKG